MNLCREKTGREDASQHATTKKCLSGTPRARKTAGQQREDPRRLECHFALFRNRPQEGGITTGVALHNLESSPGLVRCDLMREGVLLDAASIPLAANGQTSWLIDQEFPAADTSDFAGSVRCDAVGEGRFSAVALEMDPGNRIFTTLPVVPVPEMPDRE